MDNLTHSLVGALLGQCGLKRLSGRAMGTLVIAANIPDIDALATILGTESLAFRRGVTHGPMAMLLLPPLLVALVLAWNRWRPADETVRPRQLLLLAYLGTLSHPALDFLNSYGIRLLEPFSSRWVYGDTLFIIDVWIWAALVIGFLISTRRERAGRDQWRRPSVISLAAIAAYIAANGLITARAEAAGHAMLTRQRVEPKEVVANPVPVRFWRRRMLWRTAEDHGAGTYDVLNGLAVVTWLEPSNLDHPALLASRHRPDVRAFLFWSRMPIVAEEGGRAFLMDQRFTNSATRGAFRVPLDQTP